MESRNTDFKYTYSASEQEEIKRIRQKYQTREEDGMARLRKLDAKVTGKATVAALVLGIAGALIMGTGMSFIMTDLAALLGMAGMTKMVVGIITGVFGIILAALAYPMHNKVLEHEREKVAPEILRLTDELMK